MDVTSSVLSYIANYFSNFIEYKSPDAESTNKNIFWVNNLIISCSLQYLLYVLNLCDNMLCADTILPQVNKYKILDKQILDMQLIIVNFL